MFKNTKLVAAAGAFLAGGVLVGGITLAGESARGWHRGGDNRPAVKPTPSTPPTRLGAVDPC